MRLRTVASVDTFEECATARDDTVGRMAQRAAAGARRLRDAGPRQAGARAGAAHGALQHLSCSASSATYCGHQLQAANPSKQAIGHEQLMASSST